MIQITREEDTVIVKIEGGPLDSIYQFRYNCGNKWYASLLQQHFQKLLWDRTEKIRRQEYEKGYKDGRSKKAKQQYFYTSLTDKV